MAERNWAEGTSSSRPPLFSGNNYPTWKARMKAHILSMDPECWKRTMNGPKIPGTSIIDGVVTVKSEDDYTDAEWKMIQVNAKALSLMQCSLSSGEYDKVSSLNSAKEIWDSLETTYEGTSLVKESKIGILTREYELFGMIEGEDIDSFMSRLKTITNSLKNLGEKFSDEKLVKKVLRCLDSRWESMTTSLSVSKDLSNFKFDDLIGTLLTHEMRFKKKMESTFPRPKQGQLALKHSVHEASSDSDGEQLCEEELVFLTNKFNKAFSKYNGNVKKAIGRTFKARNKFNVSNSTCFGCGMKGHFRRDCPNPKQGKNDKPQDAFKRRGKKKERKAMVASWGSTSSESSDEESSHEVAAICLVGHIYDDDETSITSLEDQEVCLMGHGDNEGEGSTTSIEEGKVKFESRFVPSHAFNDLLNEYNECAEIHQVLKAKYKKVKSDLKSMSSQSSSNKVSELEAELNERAGYYASLNDRHNKLKSENACLTTQVNELKSKKNDVCLSTNCDVDVELVTKLKDELSEAKNEQDVLTSLLNSSSDRIEALLKELDECKVQSENYKNSLINSNIKNSEFFGENEKLKVENFSLNEKIKALLAENGTLGCKVNDLYDEEKTLLEKMRKLKNANEKFITNPLPRCKCARKEGFEESSQLMEELISFQRKVGLKDGIGLGGSDKPSTSKATSFAKANESDHFYIKKELDARKERHEQCCSKCSKCSRHKTKEQSIQGQLFHKRK